ncbi:MAG: aldo/keto reductase [Bacteroidia bacterium]
MGFLPNFDPMQYRCFGQHWLSRMGLGMAALGRPGYINLGHADDLARDYRVEAMRQQSFDVLDAAHAAGIIYFDAARSYGQGEAFLGEWLRSRGLLPGDVVSGSKWGYTYTADWQVEAVHHEIKDHSLPVLERQWAESRAHLMPWLQLYQIHSATLESGVLDRPEVLEALAHLRDREGVYIGLSLSGPMQARTLARVMTLVIDGRPLFDSVQATWNLLEPSAGPLLAEAHAAGMLVIVKEALANGRLTRRNTDPAFASQHTRLAALADVSGCDIDALALAAVLAQPWADAVLSGAATVAQLRSNLRAFDVPAAATADLADLAEAPETYWQIRQSLAWN